MAKKLALTAALLVALVAFATATTFTTTVITTIIDDEANPEHQQCQQQLQGKQFTSCQRFMGGGSQYHRGGGDEVVLEMITENYSQKGQELLKQCCDQLRSVDQQCRCQAIKHALQQGGGSYQGQQMQQVRQRAEKLPSMCKFRQPQQCQIRAIFV